MLEGYYPDNVRTEPRTRIVSMYVDQFPARDMSRGLAGSTASGSARASARRSPGWEEAGRGRCAVDRRARRLPLQRPRAAPLSALRAVQQIIDAIRASGRAAPVYCDKSTSLTYSWEKARRNVRLGARAETAVDGGVVHPGDGANAAAGVSAGCARGARRRGEHGPIDAYGFSRAGDPRVHGERPQGRGDRHRRGGDAGRRGRMEVRATGLGTGARRWW